MKLSQTLSNRLWRFSKGIELGDYAGTVSWLAQSGLELPSGILGGPDRPEYVAVNQKAWRANLARRLKRKLAGDKNELDMLLDAVELAGHEGLLSVAAVAVATVSSARRAARANRAATAGASLGVTRARPRS